MNITDKANQLISLNSKKWLSDQLGISRMTLDNRLINHNWKKLETERLIKL